MLPVYRYINRLANNQRRKFETLSYLKKFSGAQGKILHFLLDQKDREIFQKDIEEEFSLRAPTVTGLLKELEKKGLVRRIQSEKDARYKRILPTDQAEVYREEIFREINTLEHTIIHGIPADDLETWKRVSEQMIENMRTPAEDPQSSPPDEK